MTEDDWKDIVRTNPMGNWLVLEYVCARMSDAKKDGSIINITSISTDLNRENLPSALAYATTKSAVNGLTQAFLFYFSL
ncbi:SDR family NAD(P)-dependent oxidoreductase [Acinetobacter baumannii]